MNEQNKIVIYQTEDGQTQIDVRMENETVWLSTNQMALLFNREESNIRRHIINVFKEGELPKDNNVHFLHVNGVKKLVPFYTLDVMLIVYLQYSKTRNTFQIPVLLIMIVFLSIFSFIRFAYFQYSLYICRKIEMNDDIFESVSQRSSGEETAENRRIYEIANELHRRCQLYEAQLRVGQVNVNHLEVEQRIAELYAKETGMWIPFGGVFDLGTPGPSGNENDTYVSNDIIYKVNNLLNTGSILRLLNRLIWHNNLFYDTAYSLYGFTGFDGRTVMPIMTQRLVKDALPATAIEIETYMAAIGFVKQNKEGRFSNGIYDVWDLVPRNVLKDKDGDIFIVDAEINIK